MTINLSSRKSAPLSIKLCGVRRLVPSRRSTILFTKTVCVGSMIAGSVLFVNSCMNSGSSKSITPASVTVATTDRALSDVIEANRAAVVHQCELLRIQLNDPSLSAFAKEHLPDLYRKHCEVAS